MFVSLINCSSSSLFHCSFVVCKDGSCRVSSTTSIVGRACRDATIPYVVGPSCTGEQSCLQANIGSVDSSCIGIASCGGAQLSGVDLINSCNAKVSCNAANANGEIAELIDCCNNVDGQCQGEVGRINIVAAGGSSCVSLTCQTSDKLLLHLSNDSLFSHS